MEDEYHDGEGVADPQTHTHTHTCAPTTIHPPQIREERVWKTTTWALTMMVEEVQIGTASLLSWPYPVRFVQVFAAKLDREDELRV